MRRYLVKRVLSLLLVLFGMSVLVFGAMRLLPGDVVDLMMGMQTSASGEDRDALERRYGLDRPVVVQYLDWMGGLLQGDLGRSLRTQQPVSQELMRKLPVTVELTILSVALSVVIAIPLGVISAAKSNTVTDLLVRIVGVLGLSIPSFWLAIMLLLVSSRYFGWLPSPIFVSIRDDPVQNLQQMWMPTVSLALVMVANIMRMTRAITLEVFGQEYIRVARAKGLIERAVVVRHALRNASIPIVTLIGMNAGYLLGGSVVVEQIFGLPGLGWLVANAIFQRDYTTVQSAVLVIGLLFAVINLLVDLLYAYLDPRIHYG